MSMLSAVERTRLRVSQDTEVKVKAQFGQFLTPARIARFMAGLFAPTDARACRLLDPGAGIGSLSSAFLERCLSGELCFDAIELSAFEIDQRLGQELERTLAAYVPQLPLTYEVVHEDFIEEGLNRFQFLYKNRFTHAILNPPYKKIGSGSRHRLLLRQAGIETVNLYSAFLALTLLLMEPGGQVVAIIPRSFCNGPYYRPFREFLLARAAIRRMHLFGSRKKAFQDDDVLQENVILYLERSRPQGEVVVSTSTDATFHDLVLQTHPFDRIVFPEDPERFIHVPTSTEPTPLEALSAVRYALDDLGLHVSTGPVVDFRVQEYLRERPEPGTVPLLYSGHFAERKVEWPKAGTKKPNAICRCSETEKWLYPTGFYCVVRRFSAKEEKRRVVASVTEPSAFGDAEMLGFENHLNVFHEDRHGLPEALARGLAVFLNTTAVDTYFRRFNGHTQVNATDLRNINYPSREALMALGEWAMQQSIMTQDDIDEQVERLTR